jgi:hypothetical protein
VEQAVRKLTILATDAHRRFDTISANALLARQVSTLCSAASVLHTAHGKP